MLQELEVDRKINEEKQKIDEIYQKREMEKRIQHISEKLRVEEEKRNERQQKIQNIPTKALKHDTPPRFKTM